MHKGQKVWVGAYDENSLEWDYTTWDNTEGEIHEIRPDGYAAVIIPYRLKMGRYPLYLVPLCQLSPLDRATDWE